MNAPFKLLWLRVTRRHLDIGIALTEGRAPLTAQKPAGGAR